MEYERRVPYLFIPVSVSLFNMRNALLIPSVRYLSRTVS